MNNLSFVVLTCAASFVIVLLGWRLFYKRHARLPLPPGPQGHWLYGSAFPRPHAYRIFADWTKKYGPIFSMKVGNTTYVNIGGYHEALNIMEKENSVLVDRPRDIAAGEILGGGMRTLLARQGDRLKRIRKAIQSQLTARMIDEYKPVQQRFAKKVVQDILRDSEGHINHVQSYAASTIITITYGKPTPSTYSDPDVLEIVRCMKHLGEALQPGAWKVNQYPILQYVPGYLKTLREWHKEELELFRTLLDVVRKQMENNKANPCFAKYVLERQTEYRLSDDEAAYLAGTMFGAGSDTTAAAISIAIMAAACFPQWQEKVQKQIDKVVGRGRLPNFDDMEDLTEVTAFVLESYRWRPVSAGGFVHRATKDIIYGGYLIPEGASVIGNHWAIGRDATVFPDPESFKPERWFNKDGRIDETYKFPNFGFGRRICPGQVLANRSLFINVSLLLWAFNIKEDPKAPIDTLAFTDTANIHPLPFKVIFEAREGVEGLIASDPED